VSFLLDALRKSENQKRLGDVPTIHSASGFDSTHRTRIKPGLVILLLLPAIIVIAWYLWRPADNTDVTTGIQVPPQEQINDQAVVQEISVETPAEPVNTLVVDDPTQDQTQLPDYPPQVVKAQQNSAPRTPVESYDPPVIEQESNDTSVTGQQLPVARETDAAVSTAPQNPIPAPTPTDQAQPYDSGVVQQRDYREPQMMAISYWRLPQSVREELLVPKISVLVYAQQPENRFIIMNGRRLVEGDEPQPGMKLIEIRRDGAVFTYRLYQFLVSR
jgi:general secretion pathway protein B